MSGPGGRTESPGELVSERAAMVGEADGFDSDGDYDSDAASDGEVVEEEPRMLEGGARALAGSESGELPDSSSSSQRPHAARRGTAGAGRRHDVLADGTVPGLCLCAAELRVGAGETSRLCLQPGVTHHVRDFFSTHGSPRCAALPQIPHPAKAGEVVHVEVPEPEEWRAWKEAERAAAARLAEQVPIRAAPDEASGRDS
jgi:hypothetical protein